MRKEIEIEILTVTPIEGGSLIRFKLPDGKVEIVFASLYETVEKAVKDKLEILKRDEEWLKEGYKKHSKYKGKKIKVRLK